MSYIFRSWCLTGKSYGSIAFSVTIQSLVKNYFQNWEFGDKLMFSEIRSSLYSLWGEFLWTFSEKYYIILVHINFYLKKNAEFYSNSPIMYTTANLCD